MPINKTAAVFMLMLLCSIIFAIAEKGANPAYGTTVLESLAEISLMDIINPANWVINFVTGKSFEWGEALLSAATFNYAMFESGPWALVKYFFWILTFAWLVALVITLMRGTSSA